MPIKSKPRNILIMCESSGWQWGVGAEFINFELKNGNSYEVLDLSFLGDFKLKTRIRRLLGGFKMRRETLAFFKRKNLQVSKIQRLGNIHYRQKNLHDLLEQSPAINSIVERCQTIDLELIQGKDQYARIVQEEFRKSDLVYSVLSGIDFSDVEKIVTVNGRFTKSATVVKYCEDSGIKLALLEGGNKNSSFQIFEVSPHSTIEVQGKITQLWNSAIEPYRSEISREFLENLVINRRLPGVDFRSKIIWDKKPKFSGKKICAFFASSEWEYIGVREEVQPGHFKNQIEAFEALLTCLDKDIWDIYLRRHPAGPNADQCDGEKSLWIQFQNFPNVFVIEPSSEIDSIALGLKADLIASYGSTINIEFYARKLSNAITLGPAPWNNLLPERYMPTTEKLKDFISSINSNIQMDKLLPWAYYQMESGIEFELITTDDKTGRWKMKEKMKEESPTSE